MERFSWHTWLARSHVALPLVAVCWIVLVYLAYAFVTVGLHSLIVRGLFPGDDAAQAVGLIGTLLLISCLGVLIASISSSISVIAGRYLRASQISIAALGVFGFGFGLYFVIGGPSAKSFDYYVEDAHFRIPWNYAPQGQSRPGAGGFRFSVCEGTLTGARENHCRRYDRVVVGQNGCRHELIFRRYHTEMVKLGTRFGHDALSHSPMLKDGSFSVDKSTYYVQQYEDGRMKRIVHCEASGECQHQVPGQEFLLCFDSPEAEMAYFDENERRILRLIDTWRVP